MTEKRRKISVRKILQVLLTFVAAAGCIVAMVSASDMEAEKPLKKLPEISIKNDRRYHTLEQKKIMELAIYGRGVDIMHTPVSRLDVRGIEGAIMSDPWVANAEVYIDIDRVMHINVTRRVPVARVFRADGESYYIDSSLHTMPLSPDYTYYATVVTNVPIVADDSAGKALKAQIVALCRRINADSFWSAQVSQIALDSNRCFELMPVVGNQKVVFGDTSRMDEKFANLFTFYKNVLNRIGWDKYETLDVRYKGQVVASPMIAYSGPRDAAIRKMNWITSIEVTEAQKAHEDSIRSAQAYVIAVASAKAKAAELAMKRAATEAAKEAAAKAAGNEKIQATAKANRVEKDKKPKDSKTAAKNAEKVKAVKKAMQKEVVKAKPTAKKKEKKTVAKTKSKSTVHHPAAKAAAKAPSKKAGKAVKDKKKDSKKESKNKQKEATDHQTRKAKYTYPEGRGH